MSTSASQLVGRERELTALARALDGVAAGQTAFVELSGEPGIGKTRLLAALAADAERRGCLALRGRATEFERDAPYGLWVDAVDAHLQPLATPQLRRLAGAEPAPLAVALPAFADLLGGPAPPAERYVVHRAVRGLLERLAAPSLLVVCLDDVHWADPASLDLLAALAALGDAARARLSPAPLSEAEAAALWGGDVTPELYELSGGNPFYLEQLARARPGEQDAVALGPGGAGIPAAVAAALAGELAALPSETRRVLEAASVAGEPFEPELVTDIAGLGEEVTLASLDALLEPVLIRPTPAPRRFGFRHPLIRHAVYAAAPAAWRLQAHARAAAALERRGAGPVERARHVEHAAARGDRAAVELLADAAQRVFEQAPASAARYLESALHLLGDDPALTSERIELLQTRAYALFGAGQLEAADAALAETLELLLPHDAQAQRVSLICSRAAIAAWSARPLSTPLRRLRALYAEAPGGWSNVGYKLRMSLAGLEFYELGHDRVPALATEALAHARGIGDPRSEHGALIMLGYVHAACGRAGQARAPLDRVIAFLAETDDRELGPYELGFADLGGALAYLGRHEEALVQLRRGVTSSHHSGHGYFIPVLLANQLHPLVQLGRVGEAIAVGEEAVEAAWASANPGLLVGAHVELALARQLSGDADGAAHEAREAVRLAPEPPLWRARAGWTLGCIQLDSDPEAGIATILRAAGGPELPQILPAERPSVWAALANAELQRDDVAAAGDAAARLDDAAIDTPLARALCARTRAAVLLAQGRPDLAATTASRGAAVAAPLEAARARALEGVALARGGDRERGVAALQQAAGQLERFGARRLREHAARELRALGVRTWRRGPTVPRAAAGIDALSAREREVAALVLAGKRNTDIARELFVGLKTVESHTRNIYAKLGVSSRVELLTSLAEPDRETLFRAARDDPSR